MGHGNGIRNPDKHGKVRTVLLKTSGSTMKRPIAKLCVILSESAS